MQITFKISLLNANQNPIDKMQYFGLSEVRLDDIADGNIVVDINRDVSLILIAPFSVLEYTERAEICCNLGHSPCTILKNQ